MKLKWRFNAHYNNTEEPATLLLLVLFLRLHSHSTIDF
ncbi:hypothetical protein A79_4496 [Vibrio parahaemolyticus AQ3810]|nr:hypothetical protein A79_4496 [Vibrio parahaemolyticus AQ3810]EQM01242.1 hypothetical protein D019_3201 [Vibrio parahaemolyticus VP2007-095]